MSSVDLHHVIDGAEDAPAVVLFPSLGSTLELWKPQVAPLAEHFRVIRVDPRGHGGSPVPRGPYTIDDIGGDVVALLDRLGIERAHVVGVSLGGMVALWMAINHPGRVARIVPAATAAVLPDSGFAARAATVRENGTASIADAVLERWLTPEAHAADPARDAHMRSWIVETPDEGYAGSCEAIDAMDLLGGLAAITAPTLVISGLHDPAIPPEHQVRIAAGIPGARVAAVDAAHLPNVEEPEAVTALILEHLLGRDPYDDGMTVRRAVLGDEHVDRSVARTTPFTAPFQDFITRYAWGDVWTRPGLDRRSRSMITLALLCGLKHENELAMHVRAAIRNGLTPEEITEVFLHTAVYAGVPTANSAFAIAQQTLGDDVVLASENVAERRSRGGPDTR
jgi:3-oxoadipate enol-lactonase / 4-carboxymuconolactone decarboxylase